MTRVKLKPKYKELPGDPTKDSIKNIVLPFLYRLMSGGITTNKEMIQWFAIISRDRLNAPFFALSASSDQSVLIIFGDCL